jgi:hypothetical protein
MWWHTPVIPATWEVEAEGYSVLRPAQAKIAEWKNLFSFIYFSQGFIM